MRSSSINQTIKPLKWLEKLSSLSRHSRSLLELFTSILLQCVPLDIRAGLSVPIREIHANSRLLVGVGLLVVGMISIVFHYLFDKAARDYNWYYLNLYYLFYTIRPYIVIVFWSLSFFFFAPKKYTLAIIPFAIAQGFGWWNIMHYSFFVHSNGQFHAFPHWSLVACGISLGFSFTMCADELVYRWEHKRNGNHARFVGLAEIDAPYEVKDQKMKILAKEYRELNHRIG